MRAAQIRLAATGTLLAASGVLTVAAAAQRWWPACKIGGFDNGSCVDIQDSRYDYLSLSDPLPPVGVAIELQGIALLALAAAVLMLPGLLIGRRQGVWLSVAALLVSAGVAVSGVGFLLSGVAGEVVTVPAADLSALLWMLGLPVLAIVSASLGWTGPDRPAVWEAGRWAAAVCVMLSSPFVAYVMSPLPFFYLSYDTNPWTEAFPGAFHIGAAVALWWAVGRDPEIGGSRAASDLVAADSTV